MKYFYNRVVSSIFLKDSFAFVVGFVSTNLLSFLTVPVLARLFDPQDFGLVSVITTIITVLISIVGLQYTEAIVLPDSKKEARSIYGLTLNLLAFFSIIITSIVTFLGSDLLTYANREAGEFGYYALIPLMVFLKGFSYSSSKVLVRERMFKFLSLTMFVSGLVGVIFKIFWGKLNFAGNGLYFGLIISMLCEFLILLFLVKRISYIRFISIAESKRVLKKYSDFFCYTLPQKLLNSLGPNIVVFIIAASYGKFYLGLYDVAFRLTRKPLEIFSNSISQVLYQKISSSINKKLSIKFFVFKLASYIFILLTPLFIILWTFAHEIIYFLLGSDWVESTDVVRILIPYLFSGVFLSLFGPIHIILGKQKLFFNMSFIFNLVIIGLLLFFGNNYSFKGFLILFSSLNILIALIKISILYYCIMNYEKSLTSSS